MSEQLLTPVRLSPMTDPQYPICVFFDHLESHPVVANAQTKIALPFSFLIWPVPLLA